MTAPAGRLDHLDALRGFALLGIALMNVEFFTAPLAGMDRGVGADQAPLDGLADWLVYVFVQGKFWALFSLLFGMGFVLMLDRARAAGRPFIPAYLRRTGMLLALGLAHAWLVWAGDILGWYALGALALLLLFRDSDARAMAAWGAGLWGLTVGMVVLGAAAMVAVGSGEAADALSDPALDAVREREAAVYPVGTWAGVTAVRFAYWAETALDQLFMLPMLVGTFLVGGALARSGWVADPLACRGRWLWLAALAGAAGLLATAASLAVTAKPGGDGVPAGESLLALGLHIAGGLPLALAYAGVFLVVASRAGSRLAVFAPAGRMALSHYLLQSLVGTWLFYGYGLGLWGGIGRAGQVLGVLVFFVLQVLASRWWLARFRQGPLEWLWRVFTWWRLTPLRRTPGAATASGA